LAHISANQKSSIHWKVQSLKKDESLDLTLFLSRSTPLSFKEEMEYHPKGTSLFGGSLRTTVQLGSRSRGKRLMGKNADAKECRKGGGEKKKEGFRGAQRIGCRLCFY